MFIWLVFTPAIYDVFLKKRLSDLKYSQSHMTVMNTGNSACIQF